MVRKVKKDIFLEILIKKKRKDIGEAKKPNPWLLKGQKDVWKIMPICRKLKKNVIDCMEGQKLVVKSIKYLLQNIERPKKVSRWQKIVNQGVGKLKELAILLFLNGVAF